MKSRTQSPQVPLPQESAGLLHIVSSYDNVNILPIKVGAVLNMPISENMDKRPFHDAKANLKSKGFEFSMYFGMYAIKIRYIITHATQKNQFSSVHSTYAVGSKFRSNSKAK